MPVETRSPNQYRKRATIRLPSRVLWSQPNGEASQIYAAEKSRLNMDGDILYGSPVWGNS